jgi:hypothetical protein
VLLRQHGVALMVWCATHNAGSSSAATQTWVCCRRDVQRMLHKRRLGSKGFNILRRFEHASMSQWDVMQWKVGRSCWVQPQIPWVGGVGGRA